MEYPIKVIVALVVINWTGIIVILNLSSKLYNRSNIIIQSGLLKKETKRNDIKWIVKELKSHIFTSILYLVSTILSAFIIINESGTDYTLTLITFSLNIVGFILAGILLFLTGIKDFKRFRQYLKENTEE